MGQHFAIVLCKNTQNKVAHKRNNYLNCTCRGSTTHNGMVTPTDWIKLTPPNNSHETRVIDMGGVVWCCMGRSVSPISPSSPSSSKTPWSKAIIVSGASIALPHHHYFINNSPCKCIKSAYILPWYSWGTENRTTSWKVEVFLIYSYVVCFLESRKFSYHSFTVR